jgi:two-component system chemotaxis sensor kinase CheA
MSEKEAEEMKKMFLDEAFATIEQLEKEFQTLEANTSDFMPLIEIYRFVHSLKGQSGMAGIPILEKMFHALENLISGIQNKTIELAPGIMDLFFQSLTVVEKALNTIKNDEALDESIPEFTERLENKLTQDTLSPVELEKKSRIKELFNEYGLEEFKPESLVYDDETRSILYITITIEEGVRLKTARLFVIIKNLNACGVVAKSFPSFADLIDGKFEQEFSLLFQCSKPDVNIEEEIKACGEVESVSIKEISPEKARMILQEADQEVEVEKESTMIERGVQINSIAVEISALNELLGLFGELLIRSKQLERKITEFNRVDIKELILQMQTYMFNMQEVVLKMELVPLSTLFRLYPRMVRGLAEKYEKKVKLIIKHNNVKIDRKLLNEIGDVFVHILRNAVYHGVEKSEVRLENGKNEEGLIEVETKIKHNVLFIRISDDGAGIDPEVIKAQALSKGFYSEEKLNAMSREEIINIIFEPNFSTVEVIDLTSGRGMGLSIVKNKVADLAGSVQVETQVGKGTTFLIQFPISRSLMRALLIRAGQQIYSISLDDVQSLFEVSKEDIREINNQEYIFINQKNELIKFYRLNQLLKVEGESAKVENDVFKVVHLKKGDFNFALAVDEFLRESEIVIKKIEDDQKDVKGIIGAAILDDGTVSFIINPFSVVQ